MQEKIARTTTKILAQQHILGNSMFIIHCAIPQIHYAYFDLLKEPLSHKYFGSREQRHAKLHTSEPKMHGNTHFDSRELQFVRRAKTTHAFDECVRFMYSCIHVFVHRAKATHAFDSHAFDSMTYQLYDIATHAFDYMTHA